MGKGSGVCAGGPMRNCLSALFSALLLTGMGVRMEAQPKTAAQPPVVLWDTESDTWTATDALGRPLPTYEQVGPPRKDRTVALFYFLWLGAHVNGGPYDVSRILAQDPDAMQKPDSPLWGPLYAPHYWGEPLFGYYLTDDAYVLRKHAQMLSDAGVDVIIFDVTNQITYPSYYRALFRVFSEVRAKGGKTPQIAFLCPFGDPAKVVRALYGDLYGPGLSPDLWFRWKGKPLILADPAKLTKDDATLKTFFTFRKPQPDYFQGPTAPDMWSWLEIYPQHVFRNAQGEKEQMSVGVAQNAVGNRLATLSEPGARGRNFHNGANDPRPNAVREGLNFAEQFEHALKEDPKFLFITGWNEWIAGRFAEFGGVKQPVMFVDEFNEEFSRDIEPMRGGHGDDYYYQLVSFIRRFKGVRKPPLAGPMQTIRMEGDFSDWARVTPEYRDDIGDTAWRDHSGWNNVAHYVNRSGRNDFVLMKVARDRENLYFYVRTRDPITPHTDPNWMQLFLKTSAHPRASWEGYDFVVNRLGPNVSTGVLEISTGGWNWQERGRVRYRVQGNEMELAIRRVDLGLTDTSRPLHIEFKWADNIQRPGDIMEFTLNGDAAPNGRFNYRYDESLTPR